VTEPYELPPQAELEAMIREEAERYFTLVLPRFVTTYYRGAGCEFLWRMLDAHDRRDLSAGHGAPSAKAIRMAKTVRDVCPMHVVSTAKGQAGSVVLGTFFQSSLARGLVVQSERSVEIYAGSFRLLGLSSEALLRDEILHTIFHEYIHHFESFLLLREQPLRGREHGDAKIEHLTFEAAERQDRRHARWRIVKWSLPAVLSASLIGVVVANAPKPPVSPHVPTPAEEASAAAVAERAAEREAEAEVALTARVTSAVAQQLAPAAAEALVNTGPVYRSYGAVPGGLASPDMIASDDADAAGGTKTASVYWLLGYSHFPPALIGIAWTPTGSHVVHATIAPASARVGGRR